MFAAEPFFFFSFFLWSFVHVCAILERAYFSHSHCALVWLGVAWSYAQCYIFAVPSLLTTYLRHEKQCPRTSYHANNSHRGWVPLWPFSIRFCSGSTPALNWHLWIPLFDFVDLAVLLLTDKAPLTPPQHCIVASLRNLVIRWLSAATGISY